VGPARTSPRRLDLSAKSSVTRRGRHPGKPDGGHRPPAEVAATRADLAPERQSPDVTAAPPRRTPHRHRCPAVAPRRRRRRRPPTRPRPAWPLRQPALHPRGVPVPASARRPAGLPGSDPTQPARPRPSTGHRTGHRRSRTFRRLVPTRPSEYGAEPRAGITAATPPAAPVATSRLNWRTLVDPGLPDTSDTAADGPAPFRRDERSVPRPPSTVDLRRMTDFFAAGSTSSICGSCTTSWSHRAAHTAPAT
jgi:hypothetical protein